MVTRLSGGLTPGDGADPRTFPAIWNATAETIESQGSAISGLESDAVLYAGTAVPVDGNVLTYSTAIPGWTAGVGGGSVASLGDIGDVTITSAAEGDSLVYDGTDWVNGPRSGNAIINGDFGVWQRGTSFSGVNVYTADRWLTRLADGTLTTSRQGFSPADIEAIGYGDGEYFARLAVTGASSNNTNRILQRVEDVRTLAGQTVTLSFWAKADTALDVRALVNQYFGSGGSSTATSLNDAVSVTTSWARYSFTFTLPSVSGKTIGAGSYVEINLMQSSSLASYTLDLWGVQLEAGPVATPFRLAGGGSKAAELALCQRYYQLVASGTDRWIATASAHATTEVRAVYYYPVRMRGTPSGIVTTGTDYYEFQGATSDSFTDFTLANADQKSVLLRATSGNGVSGLTAGHAGVMRSNNTSASFALDAEL